MAVDVDQGCVFCRMLAGEAASATFHEDEWTVAVLDLRQPSWPDGVHVLVIPREHVEVVDDLDDATAAALMQTVVKVSRTIRSVHQPEGLTMWQSNGAVAGQEVPHVHLHLLTRQLGDELVRIYPSTPQTPGLEDLLSAAEALRTIPDDT